MVIKFRSQRMWGILSPAERLLACQAVMFHEDSHRLIQIDLIVSDWLNSFRMHFGRFSHTANRPVAPHTESSIGRVTKCSVTIRGTETSCLFVSTHGEGWASIAIRYGLDGPGSNPGDSQIFRARPDRAWGPASLLYRGCRSLSSE